MTKILHGFSAIPSYLLTLRETPTTGSDSNRSNYDLQYDNPLRKLGSKKTSF